MSFGDHVTGSIAGSLVSTTTGQISATLTNTTNAFTGLVGDVSGSAAAGLSASLSGSFGAFGASLTVGGALGGLSGLLSNASPDVQALFFRGEVVAIDTLSPDCTITEELTDSVTVTDHPVEFGAAITDHAFVNPCEITMHLGWTSSKNGLLDSLGAQSASPQDAYEILRGLMNQRDPVDVLSTKRVYGDMLLVGLSVRTDDRTTNILDITVKMRQVILVGTSTTELQSASQSSPAQTASVQSTGTKLLQPIKESALSTVAGIFK